MDKRVNSKKQWQDFSHELGHCLRHCGNQLLMPISFIKLQESQAENFCYHFCVPTFMLEKLELPARKKEAIALIAKTFNVETDFAKVRLERWILQKDSLNFYEKLSDPSAHYETETESDKVIYLDGDLEDEIRLELFLNTLDFSEEEKDIFISEYKRRYETISC